MENIFSLCAVYSVQHSVVNCKLLMSTRVYFHFNGFICVFYKVICLWQTAPEDLCHSKRIKFNKSSLAGAS